jgi:hypothetical protein
LKNHPCLVLKAGADSVAFQAKSFGEKMKHLSDRSGELYFAGYLAA